MMIRPIHSGHQYPQTNPQQELTVCDSILQFPDHCWDHNVLDELLGG